MNKTMNKSRTAKSSIAVARVNRLLASGEARHRRVSAGLSLRAVAADVGVSAATLYYWENGQHTPRGDLAVRYLRYLERLERELA